MKKTILLTTMLAAVPLLVWSQTGASPYAGQGSRQVRSLTDAEVESYLNGRGMGLARPAELNGHPGPMHVLELADRLRLSEAQRAETQRVFDAMRAEAVRLGRLIVEKEAGLNRLFADGRADAESVRASVGEIARLQGELRVVHLRAHLEMKRLLSPEQVRAYDELRGYAAAGDGQQHRRHGHH